MNTDEKQNKPTATRAKHWARRTHGILGVSALLFLVLLSISGIILNHADGLGLSQRAVAPWMLDLYGVELPPVDAAFEVQDVWVASSGSALYANGAELANDSRPVIGVVAVDRTVVVASQNEIFLLTTDGILIERFATDKSVALSRIGSDGRRIIVMTADGLHEFDPQQMRLAVLEQGSADAIVWSQAVMLDDARAAQIGREALGLTINWERAMLDFHSGRILPTVGRYLADLTALSVLYMCFTGLVLWRRRR
jgi:hypothetical protein